MLGLALMKTVGLRLVVRCLLASRITLHDGGRQGVLQLLQSQLCPLIGNKRPTLFFQLLDPIQGLLVRSLKVLERCLERLRRHGVRVRVAAATGARHRGRDQDVLLVQESAKRGNFPFGSV
ncbi:hypothetical protein HYQ46_012761 [Verticillium longisporum]|nr:hypothetical protein HYQ46_012761 [Verticillium longisporum]